MKIEVKYEASSTERHDTYDVEDLGVSKREWNKLSEEKKRELLMNAAETEPPYWAVETFVEIDKEDEE